MIRYGEKRFRKGVIVLVIVLFSLVFHFTLADAYHLWYRDTSSSPVTGSEPYRWPGMLPTINVSVNSADEAVRNAIFAEVKTLLNAWNIDGARKMIDTDKIVLVSPANAFTGDNFRETWGVVGDNKIEVVFDYDFSVFEALAAKIPINFPSKASINGYGPTWRRVEGGVPNIYDGYVLINLTRSDFDWQSTLVHEFGHILGLAHSSVGQFNSNFSSYRSRGYNAPTDALDVVSIANVPTMHPTSSGTGTGRRVPKADDKSAMRELYPSDTAGNYGGISGRILELEGSTEKAVKGANVRAVRIGDNTVQVSRYSSYDGNAEGRFFIGGLPPGEYKLLVEPFGFHGFDGSIYGMALVTDRADDFPQEYYSGYDESFTESLPDTHAPVTVVARTTLTGKDIKVGKVDFAFVVDDTGSMSNEIAGVLESLRNMIAKYSEDYANKGIPFPTIAIITFKDNVTIRKVSNDSAELLAVVDSFRASGGGDCPEASNAALITAGGMLSKGSTAILFTDADSRPNGPTMEAVMSLFDPKGITLSVLLTGACTEEEEIDEGALNKSMRSLNFDEFDEPPQLGEQSAIRTFSTMADATTGVFAYRNRNIEGFDREWYVNTASNIIASVFEATVALVEPATLYTGGKMDVTIIGSKTNFSAASLVEFAAGIKVNSFTAISSTRIEANVTIPSGAIDSGSVTVTTRDEVAKGGFFRIVDAPAIPILLSVIPNRGAQGSTMTVRISGVNTEFKGGSFVDFGGGITVESFKADGNNALSADISILGDAGVTVRKVKVDGVEGAGATFRVTAPVLEMPRIASAVPAKWAPGATGKLTITGSNTNFTDETVVTFTAPRELSNLSSVSVDPFSKDEHITIRGKTRKSETEFELEIVVAASAPQGYYNITATTSQEQAVIRDGIEVTTTSTHNDGRDDDRDDDDGGCFISIFTQ